MALEQAIVSLDPRETSSSGILSILRSVESKYGTNLNADLSKFDSSVFLDEAWCNEDTVVQEKSGSPVALIARSLFDVLKRMKSRAEIYLDMSTDVYLNGIHLHQKFSRLHLFKKNEEDQEERENYNLFLDFVSKIESQKMFPEDEEQEGSYVMENFASVFVRQHAFVRDPLYSELLLSSVGLAETVLKVHFGVDKTTLVKTGEDFDVTKKNGSLIITADWKSENDESQKHYESIHELATQAKFDLDQISENITALKEKIHDKNILIIGVTGSGKSWTTNFLLKVLGNTSDPAKEGDNGSCTQLMECHEASEKNVRIWDTPGLDDTYGRDEQFISIINEGLMKMKMVHSVILCLRSIERFTHSEQAIIQKYARIIGPNLAKRLTIVVNRAPKGILAHQKESFAFRLSQIIGGKVLSESIFDLSPSSSSNAQNKLTMAESCLLSLLKEPVKMGFYEKLLEISEMVKRIKDEEMRKKLMNDLLQISMKAAENILKRTFFPNLPHLKFSVQDKLVFADKKIKLDKQGRKYFTEVIFRVQAKGMEKVLGKFGRTGEDGYAESIAKLRNDMWYRKLICTDIRTDGEFELGIPKDLISKVDYVKKRRVILINATRMYEESLVKLVRNILEGNEDTSRNNAINRLVEMGIETRKKH